jgi:hypothetical protein
VIIAIHQPNFLPWLPFFQKMQAADLFVSLDDAPFSKGGFINRQRIPGPNGPRWLTMPLVKAPLNSPINHQALADGWQSRFWRLLDDAYRGAPFWGRYRSSLELALGGLPDLVMLNERLIRWLMCFLLIRKTHAHSSLLYARSSTGSQRIIDICREVGASSYLSGPRGRDYLDLDAFAAAGIGVEFHEPADIDWPGKPLDFEPSALDLVMHCGPTAHEYLR